MVRATATTVPPSQTGDGEQDGVDPAGTGSIVHGHDRARGGRRPQAAARPAADRTDRVPDGGVARGDRPVAAGGVHRRAPRALPQAVLPLRSGQLRRARYQERGVRVGRSRPQRLGGRDRDRRPAPRLCRAAAARARRPVGCAGRLRRRRPCEPVRALHRPRRQRGARGLQPAAPRARACRPAGGGGRSRHGAGMDADGRELHRPGDQGTDRRGGARGARRCGGRPADGT